MITQKSLKKIQKISSSPLETFDIARELASTINSSTLIGIQGEMGVGKTIFAKGLGEGLQVKELITSPTFLGISESYSGRLPYVHMDFYKKVTTREIVESHLKNNAVVLIEWIENFELVFREKLNLNISVYIQYLKNKNIDNLENERQIIIEWYTN